MTYLIQNILKTANKIFSNNKTENFQLTKNQPFLDLLSNLKASDVNLNQKDLDKNVLNEAPCAYIKMFENDIINFSMFSLNNKSRLPMHNHPGMFGLIKVLTGKIVVKSYDPLPENIDKVPSRVYMKVPPQLINNKIVPCKEIEKKIISHEDKNSVAILEPNKGNIHEITVAVDSQTGSTFLDIISPPYTNVSERKVSYFTVLGKSYCKKTSHDITWLLEIPCPRDYWCSFYDYTGPELNEEILKE